MRRAEFERILADARVLWDFHVIFDMLERADIIVCLGSYDLRVAERAADLYLAELSGSVLVTGAWGNWTRGLWERTEAETFGERLRERGVRSEDVILETRATNIGENIELSRGLLQGSPVNGVILVTKPQTQMRVWATAQKLWPAAKHMVTAPLLDLLSQASVGGLIGLIEEMVGDLDRLIAYPDRGFQVPIVIPDEVIEAHERLKRSGFGRHCLHDSF